MKRLIPYKVQFVISWIPYINQVVPLLFFYNCLKAQNTGRHLIHWFIRSAIILVLFSFIDIMVAQFLSLPDVLSKIWRFLFFYLTTWSLAMNVVLYQKKNWAQYFQ